MLQFTKVLIPFLIRTFIPITPFYTNFLVEIKEFTNLEVSNVIAPFYFFSSFLAVFFCKSILHSLGLIYSSVLITAIYFLNMTFFLNLRKRSFIPACLVYFISGFISTFDVVYKFYIGEINEKEKSVDAQYSYIALLKAIAGSISSVVGQEIVNRTGHYEINIHISIFTQFVSLTMSVYNAMNEKAVPPFVDVDMKEAFFSMDKIIFCAFCAGSICDCFSLFTKLFVNNIFRDKNSEEKARKESNSTNSNTNLNGGGVEGTGNNKNISNIANGSIEPSESQDTATSNIKQPESSIKTSIGTSSGIVNSKRSKKTEFAKAFINKLQNILYTPVTLLSVLLISLITFIFPKYKQEGTAQKRYLNGNADAISNVLCYELTYLISKYGPKEHKEFTYISFLLLSSVSLLLMTRTKHKIMLYFMYLCTGVFSKSCTSITKRFLKKDRKDNNLIISCYMSESICHIIIDVFCRLYKVNSVSKARIYGFIGLAIFLGIMAVKSSS
ncbi:uncharacterized protein VICG_01868 [Vittaforma corneae ATCC 50505]|uniref:Uncharacterized protein n=1 Tax=Vittaforma corneae (strain ATCC 50505) TaxID=993615 RepID=L2GKP7_VITCO|nr:uncharacterized protein VICG_01868 [Vittaforma corneae ATCC 50505]ELA41075.1 hypothetical protein VICG_01868 [Vittaforma corneae ATCC 50505]